MPLCFAWQHGNSSSALLLEMLVLVLPNPQAPVSNVLTGACGMLV